MLTSSLTDPTEKLRKREWGLQPSRRVGAKTHKRIVWHFSLFCSHRRLEDQPYKTPQIYCTWGTAGTVKARSEVLHRVQEIGKGLPAEPG